MEDFFKTINAGIVLWLLLCLSARIYLYFPAEENPQTAPWGTSLLELKKKSAYYDGCIYQGEVTVHNIDFSILNLLLLDTMEVKDNKGNTIQVIGNFPVPMVGDVILLTARFEQLMNNSEVPNCCILIQ